MSLSVTINADMLWEASVQGHKLLPSCAWCVLSLPQIVRMMSDIISHIIYYIIYIISHIP